MKRWLSLMIVIILMAFTSVMASAETLPPVPHSNIYVNDFAGVLSNDTKSNLMEKLTKFNHDGNGQIVVVTTNDFGGYDSIDSYSNALFNEWGIGSKDHDNGLLIVVNPTSRKIRMEVGRGFEGTIGDLTATKMIKQYAVPELKQNDYNAGIINLVNASAEKLNGVSANDGELGFAGDNSNNNNGSIKWFMLCGCIAVILLLLYWSDKGAPLPFRAYRQRRRKAAKLKREEDTDSYPGRHSFSRGTVDLSDVSTTKDPTGCEEFESKPENTLVWEPHYDPEAARESLRRRRIEREASMNATLQRFHERQKEEKTERRSTGSSFATGAAAGYMAGSSHYNNYDNDRDDDNRRSSPSSWGDSSYSDSGSSFDGGSSDGGGGSSDF